MSIEGNPAALEGKKYNASLVSYRLKLNKTLFSGARRCIGLTLEIQSSLQWEGSCCGWLSLGLEPISLASAPSLSNQAHRNVAGLGKIQNLSIGSIFIRELKFELNWPHAP